jgi:hypothetical protein
MQHISLPAIGTKAPYARLTPPTPPDEWQVPKAQVPDPHTSILVYHQQLLYYHQTNNILKSTNDSKGGDVVRPRIV